MEKFELEYANGIDKLKQLMELEEAGVKLELGTGFLPKGSRMPDNGTSAHPMHEISIIIEGEIETTSGNRSVTLKAGDVVSIPRLQDQFSNVLEDTRLVYIFFGKNNSLQ